jgi:murein DD-endopeptidase MepM/ murein hydrolase activator NlpD
MHGGILSLLAMACVAGLTATQSIPAFATEDTAAADTIAPVRDDLQSMTVGSDVGTSPITVDHLGVQKPVVLTWVLPATGELRDGFGPRPQQPVAGVNLFHRGQDIGAACGETIHAAAAGRVVQAGWFGTYGNWVRIAHGNGLETGYAHETTISVSVGQTVKAGQAIGTVGSTGASTGCHLHFETHINGTAVDPVPFMAARGIRLG